MFDILRSLASDLPLKILSLVLAFLLWVVAVLERTYDTTVTVPVIVPSHADADRIVTEVETKNARVTIEGKGKDLLRLRFRQLEFRPQIPEGKTGTRQVRLAPSDLKLPSSLTVRSIEPEFVEMRLTPARGREVAVIVPTKGQASGLAITSILPVTPVRLIGAEDDIALYPAVATETLDLGTVTRPGTRRLKVLLPPGEGLSVAPESVDVNIALEKEGARIFLGVPVKVVAPSTVQVEVEPEEAQVAVAGPKSRLDSLDPAAVVARIKISGLRPGEHRLAAEITLPPGFRLVKCEPQLFDITIR
ncbi:MAG: hypothetical protein ABIK44_05450 [candidate division WOR-3 bacterium]